MKHAALLLPEGLTTGGFVFDVVKASGVSGESNPPDWVQLTPRGAATARDGRSFVFDPEKLVKAFNDGGVLLPIDFDHETEFTMMLGAKPAHGWLVALEARPAGLFGKVEWLADAVAALAARTRRYISPTFWREADGVTARALKGAALVTSPALSMPSLASALDGQQPDWLRDVLSELGLPATSTAAEAVVAIKQLKAARSPPPDPTAAKVAALLGIDPSSLSR